MNNTGPLAQAPTCSFCGKDEHKVNRMIAGPGVNICDECVARCQAILAEDAKNNSGEGFEQE